MTPESILAAISVAVGAFGAWRAHRASLHARRLEQTADRERRDREIRESARANRLRSDDAAWTRLQGALNQTDAALTLAHDELTRLRDEYAEYQRRSEEQIKRLQAEYAEYRRRSDAQIDRLQAQLEDVQAQLALIHADMPEHRNPGDRTRADD